MMIGHQKINSKVSDFIEFQKKSLLFSPEKPAKRNKV